MTTMHTVSWQARWWSDDGTAHDERATEQLEAPARWEAERAVERRWRERVGYPRRPFHLAFDDARNAGTRFLARYPAGLPDRHALRARVLDGEPPAALRRALLDAGATPLEVMIAFARAFCLRDLELARDDDELARARPRWERPHRLRETHRRGGSVLDALHALHPPASLIELSEALEDGLELGRAGAHTTKRLIDLACRRDPRFDELLARALDEARAAERR